jgi:hypothetical protein
MAATILATILHQSELPLHPPQQVQALHLPAVQVKKDSFHFFQSNETNEANPFLPTL